MGWSVVATAAIWIHWTGANVKILPNYAAAPAAISILLFFALKIGAALALIKLSAHYLSVADFTVFSQLIFFSTLLVLLCGGIQNGLTKAVAAAESPTDRQLALSAAFGLWCVIASIFIPLCTIFPTRISTILTGTSLWSWLIPWLAVGAFGTGLGQIFSSFLVGQRKLARNLLTQSSGIVVATGAAAWFFIANEPIAAILSAVFGNVAILPVGWLLSGSSPHTYSPRSSIHLGVKYAKMFARNFIAFLLVSAMLPLALMLLRDVYRQHFGVEALAFWLVANRISDVTSQLLGLFLRLLFLPVAARAPSIPAARAIVQTTSARASLLMFSVFIGFVVTSPWSVPLLLSPEYGPATPLIAAYLAGDILRVPISVVAHFLLARDRLTLYVLLEGAFVTLFAAAFVLFLAVGLKIAPFAAYCGAYSIVSGAVWIAFRRYSNGGSLAHILGLDSAKTQCTA